MLYITFRGNVATRHGTEMEEIAKQTGHTDLEVESCGLSVALETPWLAASPDGVVRDPNNVTHPTGLVEIKNPYSTRQLTLTEACNSSTFCLEQKQRDGQVAYRLKRNMTIITRYSVSYTVQTRHGAISWKERRRSYTLSVYTEITCGGAKISLPSA